jgi:ribosomal protein L23
MPSFLALEYSKQPHVRKPEAERKISGKFPLMAILGNPLTRSMTGNTCWKPYGRTPERGGNNAVLQSENERDQDRAGQPRSAGAPSERTDQDDKPLAGAQPKITLQIMAPTIKMAIKDQAISQIFSPVVIQVHTTAITNKNNKIVETISISPSK